VTRNTPKGREQVERGVGAVRHDERGQCGAFAPSSSAAPRSRRLAARASRGRGTRLSICLHRLTSLDAAVQPVLALAQPAHVSLANFPLYAHRRQVRGGSFKCLSSSSL